MCVCVCTQLACAQGLVPAGGMTYSWRSFLRLKLTLWKHRAEDGVTTHTNSLEKQDRGHWVKEFKGQRANGAIM